MFNTFLTEFVFDQNDPRAHIFIPFYPNVTALRLSLMQRWPLPDHPVEDIYSLDTSKACLVDDKNHQLLYLYMLNEDDTVSSEFGDAVVHDALKRRWRCVSFIRTDVPNYFFVLLSSLLKSVEWIKINKGGDYPQYFPSIALPDLFRAVGNGQADDSFAIKDALSYISMSDAESLYIPNQYLVTEDIHYNEPVHVMHAIYDESKSIRRQNLMEAVAKDGREVIFFSPGTLILKKCIFELSHPTSSIEELTVRDYYVPLETKPVIEKTSSLQVTAQREMIHIGPIINEKSYSNQYQK